MAYKENPRKIFGRVEIVYSDEELSKDIRHTESGNSTISHPEEVYDLPSEPTARACTMDGNSTMDGTFQMIDDTCVCGWWSGALSDASGRFTQPPTIELSFVQRPIIYWTIIGDSKLGQYPVDFTVEYRRNGVTVQTDTVTGNAQMEVKLQPRIADITSVRVKITRWSQPNACVKLLRCYERLNEVYEGSALQSFEVNEEMCPADGSYAINSDTMTVSIYNEDRKFDKGYLRSLLLLDRKIRPYIGTEENGQIRYTPLGIFYSDEWQVSQDSQWVKCSAVDKLLRLQDKEYVGFPLTYNATLYEIAEDILTKAGYSAEQYQISTALKDVAIPTAYLPKLKVWDALQEIANAGLCKIYVDREDRIIIASEEDQPAKSGTAINPGNTFNYVSNISLTEFANRISVEYSEITVEGTVIEAGTAEVYLDPEEVVELTIGYTSDVAYAAAQSNNANVRIGNFSSGVNACTCTLTNQSKTYQTAVITISGSAIQVTNRTITKSDEESIEDFGVVEYSHPASELIQTREHAEYIASVLLRKKHAGEGVITTVWRGDPALGLGDEYDSTDRFGEVTALKCEYNKFSYDGGLKQETRGRK